MIERIVEAVDRWTCDGCGKQIVVPSSDPTQLANWIAVCIYPMRSRPDDTSGNGSKHFCGPCADLHKLRPLASAVTSAQNRAP